MTRPLPMADGYPRPLSDREAEILRFMLGVDDDRLDPLREQSASAVVTGMCTCGCATIDLAVDRERGRPATLCSPVLSTTTPASEHPTFGILVFLDDGWLSLLEIWYIEELPTEFPRRRLSIRLESNVTPTDDARKCGAARTS